MTRYVVRTSNEPQLAAKLLDLPDADALQIDRQGSPISQDRRLKTEWIDSDAIIAIAVAASGLRALARVLVEHLRTRATSVEVHDETGRSWKIAGPLDAAEIERILRGEPDESPPGQ